MRPTLVVMAVAACVGALLLARLAADPGERAAATPTLAGPPRELVFYGHVRSLVRKGAAYELRVDPAAWLGGTTASRAAAEDGVVAPGEPVPNDYYVVDEGRRLFTYRVPPSAPVTVVTMGPRSTRIGVAELAAIVQGRNPRGRALFGRSLGYWVRVATDTVRALDQQYQP